jgi:uncharacterized protein YbjT (DUF2867 family)
MLLTVSPFYHYNTANFEGGPNDPIVTIDERRSQYGGAQATFTADVAKNNVQVGFYGFHQTDDQLFALTFNDGSNPNLAQREQPSGNLVAVFIQDKFAITPWLTLTGGVRQTHFSGGISEDATSPRVGASLQIPSLIKSGALQSIEMVLLTGATGYIGSRLLRRLEDDGRAVRCLGRHPERVAATKPTTEIVRGDCLDEASLEPALAGVSVAYYLVHSMGAGADFATLDRRAAENIGRAAARAGVRRIIYLGGLGDDAGALSAHLKSRAETGEVLRRSGVPVVEFRASIVIGAGSLSFEMIRALVERLPVMVCPRWVRTLTQPVAVDDVLAYLIAALDLPDSSGNIFEIGGPNVVSYGDMMREYARLRGLHRLMLPVPVLTPRLSGLWLALVAPAQARVGRALVESLKNSTVVHSAAAREAFRIEPTSLRVAFVKAINDGAALRLKQVSRRIVVNASPADAFAPIRRIGGQSGWYFGNILWHVRGWIDQCMGGVGMRRGRRDAESCRVGDVVDGWTVDAYEPDRRLRLAADLKMPGRGTLEFQVTPLDDGRQSEIRQTASFDPRGLLGRAYWLALHPMHALMFRGMLRNIARRAEAAGASNA